MNSYYLCNQYHVKPKTKGTLNDYHLSILSKLLPKHPESKTFLIIKC